MKRSVGFDDEELLLNAHGQAHTAIDDVGQRVTAHGDANINHAISRPSTWLNHGSRLRQIDGLSWLVFVWR